MPLIVMFVLISIIAAICVGAPFGRPSETAELNKNIDKNGEQISAATATTVNAGQTYTVPETGIYKIELHGGHGVGVYGAVGGRGGKVTGYIMLSTNDKLETDSREGGKPASSAAGKGGNSIHINLNGTMIMGAGAGAGNSFSTGKGKCLSCGYVVPEEYKIDGKFRNYNETENFNDPIFWSNNARNGESIEQRKGGNLWIACPSCRAIRGNYEGGCHCRRRLRGRVSSL